MIYLFYCYRYHDYHDILLLLHFHYFFLITVEGKKSNVMLEYTHVIKLQVKFNYVNHDYLIENYLII